MDVPATVAEELEDGRRSTSRWLKHPATRMLVKAGQKAVLPAFAVARSVGVEPTCDGRLVAAGMAIIALSGIPGDPATAKSLSAIDQAIGDLPFSAQVTVARALEELRANLLGLATELAVAGVPIDPGYSPDLMILAQLCALTTDDHWRMAIGGDLIWAGPSMFRGDGRGAIHRDGRGERGRHRADQIAAHIRESQPDFCGESLRSRGGRPVGSHGKGSEAEQLRQVLPQVLARHPQATITDLRNWTGGRGSAGVMLRDLLRRRPGDRPPSDDTLRRVRNSLPQ